jgi:nucleolar complex protein 2
VYNKLVTTALKYTPVVLEHHIPYKTLPNGKLYVHPHPYQNPMPNSPSPLSSSKPPTQTPTQKTLQKLILSYFHNIIHILSQLTETETLQLALGESAKVLPYVVGSRKAVRGYLKVRFFGGLRLPLFWGVLVVN